MSLINNLFEAVNNYYHDHGCYPTVEVSKEFWDNHPWDIDRLSKVGVDIRVVEIMHFRSFRLLPVSKGQNIDTLNDLKKLVDKLVQEGKGHWPVRGIPPDSYIFLPIHLYPIVPGDKPEDHDLENEISAGYPKIEYIRLIMGDIDGKVRD